MAQIDALLSHMIATGTTRALLRGDVPSQLETANGVSEGNIVSNTTLEDIFLEIAPDQACQDISESSVANFDYSGFSFHITINPETEILSFNISPVGAVNAYSAAPESEPNPQVQEFSSTIPSAYDIPESEPLPQYAEVAQPIEAHNQSEQDESSSLPPEIRGFNWGAFFLPLFWSIAHNTWIGLLTLVPCFGIFMQFALGFKGNEWAWKNRQFNSLVQFRNVQRAWTLAGVAIFAVGTLIALPITAGVMFPVFGRARENALNTSCRTNLTLIAFGVMQYAQAHNGTFPIGNSTERLKQELQPYLPKPETFNCPADETKGNDDYVLNKHVAGQNMVIINDATNTPLVWEKNPNAHLGGRNIAFADGHVKWYREAEFQAWIAPYK